MSGDPKVRRWLAEFWVVFPIAAFLWFLAAGPLLAFDAGMGAWTAIGFAGVLPIAAFGFYCMGGVPWLTPEERVAKLEREADEALAREIALLEQPRGLQVAYEAARKNPRRMQKEAA